ncbi:hypothetical protein ACFSVK_06760 [Azorhizophilus paspali]|uniref:hypothetical protein n=1 Tax=Azorhizophilus paspali TaxID=69963 RepID=UPI003627DDDB
MRLSKIYPESCIGGYPSIRNACGFIFYDRAIAPVLQGCEGGREGVAAHPIKQAAFIGTCYTESGNSTVAHVRMGDGFERFFADV